MSAKETFFVIGPDNLPSWDSEKDEAERFATEKAARARALELANSDPGEPYLICKALYTATAPVGRAFVE